MPFDIWQYVIVLYLNYTARTALSQTCSSFRQFYINAANYFDKYYIPLSLNAVLSLQEESLEYIQYLFKFKLFEHRCHFARNFIIDNPNPMMTICYFIKLLLADFTDYQWIHTQLEKLFLTHKDRKIMYRAKDLIQLLNLESAKLLIEKIVAITPDFSISTKFYCTLPLSYEGLYFAALVHPDVSLVDWFAAKYGSYLEYFMINLSDAQYEYDILSLYWTREVPAMFIERNKHIIEKYKHLFRHEWA